MSTPDELIERLALAPHPEGGWFRRAHTGTVSVTDPDGGTRPGLTLIYYLLERGSHSAWHRIDADEVWHAVAGAGFRLWTLRAGEPRCQTITPGDGADAWVVVPGGTWQAAEIDGDWGLATCTVGPGFDFTRFTLLRDDSASRHLLDALAPEMQRLA